MNNLPAAKKEAAEVAKLTTGIASAVAGIFLPGAGVMGPIASYAIEKWVRRPEALLIEELRQGNIEILTDEKAATFIPMAYKFFEAAKEGEYEHNLKLLAEFIKNEMKTDAPNPSGFARMARRIEGITLNELRVIALIEASLAGLARSSQSNPLGRQFVSAHQLANDPNNRPGFDPVLLQQVLTEFASRGLLIADGATRLSKGEEYYFPADSFTELISKARSCIDAAGGS